MLTITQLVKRFRDREVLRGVSLSLEPGKVGVLIGPSGSGKSTILRCVNGLESFEGGEIAVAAGRLTANLSYGDRQRQLLQIRRSVGMVFQQFNLFPQMTALENVMFGPLRARGANREEARRVALELLDKVGLRERAGHRPAELSGGQQQRVAIARALAIRPKLMLFDEPTSALDPELRHEVLKVMQTLAEEGMTMIVVTHEMDFARRVGSRLIFMEGGAIVLDGNPQALITNPPSQRFRDFLRHVA